MSEVIENVMVENEALTVARSIAEVHSLLAVWRAQNLSVGLVPTMGSLHDGHLALLERARAENDRVLATIFVNPLQFSPAEDFEAYPRDNARDFAILQDRRCNAVFAPAAREMFPDGTGSIDEAWTRVSVAPLAGKLCGVRRPSHFDGVATIVLKLLMIAQPDVTYFGEKDYQQLTIIRRMVRDLSVPVRICGVPIVREHDGLALSSRNVYLRGEQRANAPALARVLNAIRQRICGEGADVEVALADGRAQLVAAGFEPIDYLTLASGETLESLADVRAGARLFVAAWMGRTRLIDNIAVAAT